METSGGTTDCTQTASGNVLQIPGSVLNSTINQTTDKKTTRKRERSRTNDTSDESYTSDDSTPRKRRQQQRKDPSTVKVTGRQRSTSDTIGALINSGEAYPSIKKSGRVLIINNHKFRKSLCPLPGSETDIATLESVFSQLGSYSIETKQNLTVMEIRTCLEEEASHHWSDVDCFICVISSHGTADCIYGSDGNTLPIKDITAIFDGEKCPDLRGKPKLFFIDACQGDKEDVAKGNAGHSSTGFEECKFGDDGIPIKADILVALSTTPDYVSYASPEAGSRFTQALVEGLAKYAHELDIQRLLTKVNAILSKKGEQKKQMSWISHTLTKDFHF